jgi:hypothetical protein
VPPANGFDRHDLHPVAQVRRAFGKTETTRSMPPERGQ